MTDSEITVSYIIFPVEKEDGTLSYTAACVFLTDNRSHPIGVIKFDNINVLEEFLTRGLEFCNKEKIRGVPGEIIDAFKENENGE